MTAGPPVVPRWSGAQYLLLRNVWVHKGHGPWTMALYSIFEPILYLLAIGVGIGRLVGDIEGVDVGYAAFVAPGLLATAVMNSALHETMESAFVKFTFDRFYRSVLSTPVSLTGVVVGEVAWSVLRGLISGAGFLLVITVFGLVSWPWALLSLAGTVLVAFAFGGAGLAVTTWIKAWHDFQWVQLVLLPMFLFATTFYPVTVYPGPVQVAVELLPLYHAIQLLRSCALGDLGPDLWVSVAYLTVMGVLGLVVARWRWARILLH
ncbi:ABC transporter permease [Sphaerisporangium album]|uniref:ABC transporter permease n=1 Tax=Sphaerisporangium album TaxID=509200 RepID=UPI0015F0B6F6|nr:ABC transporter permease [Sphaerisporangium album]